MRKQPTAPSARSVLVQTRCTKGRTRFEGQEGANGDGDGDGDGNGNGSEGSSGNRNGNGSGSGDENGDDNGEVMREGRELGYPPYHDRSRVEHVKEGVTPTSMGNQQPQPRDLTPERSRRTITRITSQGREGRSKGRESGSLGIVREDPPKHCRGETENGRELRCRNRKRRYNSTNSVRCRLRPAVCRRQPGSGEGNAARWGVLEWQ